MANNFTLGARILQGAPEFPSSILDTPACHGLVGEFVRAVDPHTEADPVAILTQFIVAFGNVIGRQAHFPVEADKHHLNLFMALVGQSAKGRKGTSWGYVRNRFSIVESNWDENQIRNGLSSGEGLIKAISPHKSGEQSDEKVDKRLLVYEGEFASVLQMLRRDGNSLSAVLRNLWDSGNANIMTRSDPLQVSGAHVSIVGHITQDELIRLLSSNEAANGFANRFLWVCVRRSKRLPEGGNINDVNFYHIDQRLRDAVELGRHADRIVRDDKARKLWIDTYDELSAEHRGMLGNVTARAEAQTMRLACLYALLDNSLVVKKVHLEAALALWRYCFDSARFIFGNSPSDANANRIISALEDAGDEGLTGTQISNLFGRNLSAEQLRNTLDSLANANQIHREKKPSIHGRPREIWRIVPEPAPTPPTPQKIEVASLKPPIVVPPQTSPSTSLSTHEINEENEHCSATFPNHIQEDNDDDNSSEDDLSCDEYDHDETEGKNEDAYNSRPFSGYEEEAYI